MRHYVTNEFKHSAIAKDESHLITKWADVKWLVISTSLICGSVLVGIIAKLG